MGHHTAERVPPWLAEGTTKGTTLTLKRRKSEEPVT